MNETLDPSPGPHLSTLRLHQLRLGELPVAEAVEARQHLERCPICAARFRHQEQIRSEFVLKPLPPALREARERRVRLPPWRWLGPVLAAVAALGFLVLRPADSEGIRTRGIQPTMEVWMATTEGARPVREADRLASGDRVAIKYDAGGASHVGFAGRDSSGLVEVYGVYEVPSDGLVAAPFGLELDEAPGEQELFVVTGGADLDDDRVKKAVTSRVPLDGVRVERAVIEKVEPVQQ